MSSEQRPSPRYGGIVHAYLGYDPKRFPPPSAPPPDLAGAAMEHMLRFGHTRNLTPEELARAVKLDPSQIAGLGPSLDALIAMLEERKRKILETYETTAARREATEAFLETAGNAQPPRKFAEAFDAAVRRKQVYLLEKLWYAVPEDESFATELLRVRDRLGESYEVEELASKYTFAGHEPMGVPKALEIKEELESIDALLKQLREALENAQIAMIDLDELKRFVSEADADQLGAFQDQIREELERMAEEQGIERDSGAFKLSPKATRLFQQKLLGEIFSELDASRSGRHSGPVEGDGVVETPQSRPFEFGDSPASLDAPQTLLNAASRAQRPGQVRVTMDDLAVHRTRNTPKCATVSIVDMSGSMRHGGQYVQTKRMAIALDGLIRSEYPGDFVRTISMASLAKPVEPGKLAELMPMPVTIRDPVVRLRADLSDPEISEAMIPPHFTNIQHALSLARRMLHGADTTNKQVMLLTDGLPTAHFEGEQLFLLYPPDPLTERATMREAMLCAREGITINIFLLPSWSQDEDDIAFAQRLAETTGGRVLFPGGEDLDRFVLWDYVRQRRTIIG